MLSEETGGDVHFIERFEELPVVLTPSSTTSGRSTC
jgi:hypothetical protein